MLHTFHSYIYHIRTDDLCLLIFTTNNIKYNCQFVKIMNNDTNDDSKTNCFKIRKLYIIYKGCSKLNDLK